MMRWNSSPHPISDIRDWSKAGRLELRPDFQRRAVWSAPARIMLMDTILRGIPMPKIFLSNIIRDDNTYRIVIDGQQRISAILDFLRDQFSLDRPYTGDKEGKRFSELDQETQDRFLSYRVDFNEAYNTSDEENREVYSRVNKYTVPLNKQELRRADYPGDFLSVSEELADEEYFDSVRIFTPANRRRYADVEYVSELLAAMIDGIQDKKSSLDGFYIEYANWDARQREVTKRRFLDVLTELRLIFDSTLDISKTRFRQRADFYTLFLVVDGFVSQGHTIRGKEIEFLQRDLRILHENIRPESDVEICSEYAIKCVSQGNSASSRRWRHRFLMPILAGTYLNRQPDSDEAFVYCRLKEGLRIGEKSGERIGPEFRCPICDKKISGGFAKCVLAWDGVGDVYQIANANWIHRRCAVKQSDLVVLEPPKDGDRNLL